MGKKIEENKQKKQQAEKMCQNVYPSPSYLHLIQVLQGIRWQLMNAITLNLELTFQLQKQVEYNKLLASNHRRQSQISQIKLQDQSYFGRPKKQYQQAQFEREENEQNFDQKQEDRSLKADEDKQGENKIYPMSETKNLVKTLVMAICKHIFTQRQLVTKILKQKNLVGEESKFYHFIGRMKREVSYLKDFRRFIAIRKKIKYNWFKDVFRILCFEFLRQKFLQHIFESDRIKNKTIYLKFRRRMLDGLRNPDQIRNLKDY